MSRVIELRNAECRAIVALAGGAVLEAEVSGTPLLVPKQSPGLATRLHGREASFPLVPFGGRIENNGFHFQGRTYQLSPNTEEPLVLHGDGWLRPWSVIQATQRSVHLHLESETHGSSPFRYAAEQHIELLEQGLRMRISVTNHGRETLPFGIGFHPYLPLSPDSCVYFASSAMWSERDNHLCGERHALTTPLDFSEPRQIPDNWINNCFENWSGLAEIRRSSGQILSLSADPVFGWLMVYKPSGPSDFLCLEPMSHRPNCHDDPKSGRLVSLEPGEFLSGSVAIELIYQ